MAGLLGAVWAFVVRALIATSRVLSHALRRLSAILA